MLAFRKSGAIQWSIGASGQDLCRDLEDHPRVLNQPEERAIEFLDLPGKVLAGGAISTRKLFSLRRQYVRHKPTNSGDNRPRNCPDQCGN